MLQNSMNYLYIQQNKFFWFNKLFVYLRKWLLWFNELFLYSTRWIFDSANYLHFQRNKYFYLIILIQRIIYIFNEIISLIQQYIQRKNCFHSNNYLCIELFIYSTVNYHFFTCSTIQNFSSKFKVNKLYAEILKLVSRIF